MQLNENRILNKIVVFDWVFSYLPAICHKIDARSRVYYLLNATGVI